jgi:hypothetical protein
LSKPADSSRNIFATRDGLLREDSPFSVILTSGDLHGAERPGDGDVVMTSGSVTLAEGAVVHGDMILSSRSIAINQAPGASVEGQISYNIAPWAVSTGVKSLLLLCCIPLLILVGLFLLLGIGVGRSSRRKPVIAHRRRERRLQQKRSSRLCWTKV